MSFHCYTDDTQLYFLEPHEIYQSSELMDSQNFRTIQFLLPNSEKHIIRPKHTNVRSNRTQFVSWRIIISSRNCVYCLIATLSFKSLISSAYSVYVHLPLKSVLKSLHHHECSELLQMCQTVLLGLIIQFCNTSTVDNLTNVTTRSAALRTIMQRMQWY